MFSTSSSSSSVSWRKPSLRSRKEIWETFPVSLMQLGRCPNDGAERHAVVWNRKKLVHWRETCTNPNAWFLYEKSVEAELLAELQRSNKWCVEPRQRPDQICVLRMVFQKTPTSWNRLMQPYTECVPILTRLKDIRTFFPMVTFQEEDPNSKTYSIFFQSKHVQDPSCVSYNLYKALQASTAWTVLPSEGEELCRIAFA
jgi:hypothetical protein